MDYKLEPGIKSESLKHEIVQQKLVSDRFLSGKLHLIKSNMCIKLYCLMCEVLILKENV